MAESEKQKLSQRERQLARIEQLKKQLQQEEAKLRSSARKERNGQLIALGIFMELYYKSASSKIKKSIEERIREVLTGRNLERALAALERLSQEMASRKEEISPEPPSQLPEAEAKEKNQGSA